MKVVITIRDGEVSYVAHDSKWTEMEVQVYNFDERIALPDTTIDGEPCNSLCELWGEYDPEYIEHFRAEAETNQQS